VLAKAFSLRGGERDGAVGATGASGGGGRACRLGMVAGGGMLEDEADEVCAGDGPSLTSVYGIRAGRLVWLDRLVLVGW
jgi:hypothetical protein